MEITILIEKTNESDHPKFADVKLYHKECKGGMIEPKREGRLISNDLSFSCRRCHVECKVTKERENEIKSEIVKTSLDGQERTISVEKDGNSEYAVSLLPKDPSAHEIDAVPEDQNLSFDLSDE